MSHFAVAVIGDVDAQMEQFNEQDENYFVHVDRNHEELLKDYQEHKEDKKFIEVYPSGTLEDFLMWWCGMVSIVKGDDIPNSPYALFDRKGGELLEAYYFYNKIAVYDYYVEGYDAFITKDGKKTNKARIGDLDFEAMFKKHNEETGKYYDEIISICGGIPKVPRTWKSLTEQVDKGEITIKQAREIYHEQPDVKNFNEKDKGKFRGFDFSLGDFACTREEYIKKNPPLLCYGLVCNSEYHSQGVMGWWGMSNDKLTDEEWSEKFWELVKNTDPDETITMLDCHI